MTQFTGAHKQQRCQFQGVCGDNMASVAVNGSKQLANAGRFGNGRVMFGHNWLKRSTQGGSYIMLGALRLNGIAEHLAATLAGSMGGFVSAPAFNALQHLE